MELSEKLLIVFVVIIAIVGITCIVTSIYCFITYGNLPITEVPSWALPFIFGGRR